MRLWLLTIFFVFTSGVCLAQDNLYYVVVGAFAKEKYAKSFAGFVRRKHMQCNYELNPQRNLFYVYVLRARQKSEAVALAKELQALPEFFDAWVYTKYGSPSGKPLVRSENSSINQTSNTNEQGEIKNSNQSRRIESSHDSLINKKIAPEKDSLVQPSSKKKRVVRGKLFRFEIITPNGDSIKGKINHVNLSSLKDIDAYVSRDYTDVPPPDDSKEITLICGIFGYREISKYIDYDNPAKIEGYKKDKEGAWMVPFHLEPLQPGDISIMYEVSFAQNSVALLASSITDLEKLFALMKENPTMEIIIHGHANGTGKRMITTPGSYKDYFGEKTYSKKTATSQELSELRAREVQNYLAAKGIDASRSKLKGHGGQNMIVPESSPANSVNDRIEIEIVAKR